MFGRVQELNVEGGYGEWSIVLYAACVLVAILVRVKDHTPKYCFRST